MERITGWLVDWLLACLLACFFACLADWLVGAITGWLAGWLAACLLACLLVCLFGMKERGDLESKGTRRSDHTTSSFNRYRFGFNLVFVSDQNDIMVLGKS